MEVYLELKLSKINHLPISERPREKALRFGLENLSNNELLAILIGSGYHDCSAIEVATRLLNQTNGLHKLFAMSYEEITSFKGVGPVTALRLKSCYELIRRYINFQYDFDVKNDIESLYQKHYANLKTLTQEVVVLVVLNYRKKIIYEETLYKGVEDSVLLNAKTIIKKVILHKGKCFYLIHNHPSGMILPSSDDMIATSEIFVEANRNNIIFLDHLIVGECGYYSFDLAKPIYKK